MIVNRASDLTIEHERATDLSPLGHVPHHSD